MLKRSYLSLKVDLMGKSEVDELTEETIAKGGILARLYFDMQSEKQEDLQPIMAEMINNRLLKSQGVIYCVGEIKEPIKLEDVYTTSASVTTLVKDIGSLVNISFNFVPAAIEILKPLDEIRISANELQSLLLDIANISINYSQYILGRVLSKEDYEKVMKDIKNREALGKKMLDEKKKDQQ